MDDGNTVDRHILITLAELRKTRDANSPCSVGSIIAIVSYDSAVFSEAPTIGE